MALKSLQTRKKRRMMSDMNVVPYIDVMLVLVLILMVAAPFVNPSVINLGRSPMMFSFITEETLAISSILPTESAIKASL